jgi:hypothetical protein
MNHDRLFAGARRDAEMSIDSIVDLNGCERGFCRPVEFS